MHLAHVISPYFHREVAPYTLMQSSRSCDAQQRCAAGATPAQQANLRFKKKPAAGAVCCGALEAAAPQKGTEVETGKWHMFFQGFRVKVAAFWFISVCAKGV